MKRIVNTRKRKVAVTFLAVAVAAIAGLAVATVLQDAVGPGTGKYGVLGNVTVTAGPAPGQTLLPGGSAPASVHVDNPNGQTEYVIRVDDTTGDFLDPQSNLPLPQEIRDVTHVNSHDLATAVSVPPGGTDLLVPNTFTLDANAPFADYQGKTFVKNIQLRLASSPTG